MLQVRITDEMLYLNITFYTNRTQDNYLQKTHSRHSFDWQERISRYPIFRCGARGEIGGYIPRRSMLAPRQEVKSCFFGDFWHL